MRADMSVNHPDNSKACSDCIVSLPCGCSLKSKNMFIHASIRNCQNMSKPSIHHSVNLPVLLEFYKEYEEIYNISTRKTFAEPISIGLPNFDVVQKRFSDVISQEKDAELSLKKIVSNVKSKNRMFVTETSKLIDDLGFLAKPISNKLQNVFLGLSFSCRPLH